MDDTINISNTRGDRISILPYGAILQSWEVALSTGQDLNILLGHPLPSNYEQDRAYLGAIIGRYSNRIAYGRFNTGDRQIQLSCNEGEHHLHGGENGFHKRQWQIVTQSPNSVNLSLVSPDGDQGYPGELAALVSYELDDTGTLTIRWQASTDADTVVGLTSHGYFNLAGQGDIMDHYLQVLATQYTPVDADMIPTGELAAVSETPLDLRHFKRLRDLVTMDHPEIRQCSGLDHNFAAGAAGVYKEQANLLCPATNLQLTASSTLPGLQCYTGNHLQALGTHGSFEGVCLEPQYYPDSPNQPRFPSPLLRAGDIVEHRISYQVQEIDAAGLLAQGQDTA